jgi:hypothetical protein
LDGSGNLGRFDFEKGGNRFGVRHARDSTIVEQNFASSKQRFLRVISGDTSHLSQPRFRCRLF